jgi:hypothetical protein
MKVFISWSGDRSRAVGDILRRWFPSVLQAVRPYFSPDDVAKGSRWSSEIAKELESSNVGLLVITPENQEAPWLLFEAGALAKNLDRSKVCPLLFGGMEPTDVKGPLVQFQAAQFCKEEMRRVIKMMNGGLADIALPPEVLENVFEMWWPKLEADVGKQLEVSDGGPSEVPRSDRDLLEEVLALTRRMTGDRGRRSDLEHPALDDLFMSILDLARLARSRVPGEETNLAIQRLVRPLQYFVHKSNLLTPGDMERARRNAILAEIAGIMDSDSMVKMRVPSAVEPGGPVA